MTCFILLLVVGALLSQGSAHPRAVKRPNVGIFGGHQIPIEWAPYMASLRYSLGEGKWMHMCGASIIHEQFLLTAAHCVYNAGKVEEYKIIVGTEVRGGDNGEEYQIEEFIPHSNYSFVDGDNHDIALIKLSEPITFGPKVAKTYLATPALEIPQGSELNITGWGYTDSYAETPMLLQVAVPMVSDELCGQVAMQMHFEMTDNVICAGSIGEDTCQGDSGGPLSLGNLQVGITSQGLGCGIAAGVYTRVSAFFDWITEQIYVNQ